MQSSSVRLEIYRCKDPFGQLAHIKTNQTKSAKQKSPRQPKENALIEPVPKPHHHHSAGIIPAGLQWASAAIPCPSCHRPQRMVQSVPVGFRYRLAALLTQRYYNRKYRTGRAQAVPIAPILSSRTISTE